MLEIKNLHVKLDDEDKVILKGCRPRRAEGRSARHHGPERLGQVDARPTCSRAATATR